jgi:Mg-chelatase subunit ChlD
VSAAAQRALQSVPPLPANGQWWEGGQYVPVGQEFSPRRIQTPLDRLTRSIAGRRSETHTDRKTGRYVRARPSPRDATDLAFDATLRAAAVYQHGRDTGEGPALRLVPSDYQRKVRVKRAANLVLFVLDASWSMAVAERMQATKGAIVSLLADAYQRRDRVGLVVFQKQSARLVLRPTNSVELARRALADIPVGGKTPLTAGLQLAFDVISRERHMHRDLAPLMVLLTDGAGNVSLTDSPPLREAYRVADRFPEAQIRSVIVNMEHELFDQGLAQELAHHLAAPCYTLAQLRADALVDAIHNELAESDN